MGLFGKRATKTPTIGHFHAPYEADQVLNVVYAGIRDQLTSAAPEVGTPQVMASIYLSRLSRNGLTVTAGNLAETYFQFVVDLTAADDGTDGHAYFDRPSTAVQRWMGNAIQLHFGLRAALDNASVSIKDWRLDF
nr:hypothetical protein [Kibdelosporangium sp. MJ126-NF4]CEL13485.1 hypothetical protein [Kibdelosporangium sp. MJ126-NF4]CTQ99171.1 hypothetical protein [Kibdelosporangium sp. MJ126-NF4]